MAFRIFVTTDNHIGYNEDDAVRGGDAPAAFNEAMALAASEGVDLILQGGDLFHTNRPSKQSLYEVVRTLRRTCLGDKPVEFEVLNHGPLSLRGAPELDHVNYLDPNFNVGIPLFCISGNHDDAGGSTQLMSPLDVLAAAGLLNHFGRVPDSSEITVVPILMAKSGIRVALYGLACVRDERLFRTFRENKVRFLRPRDEPESYYNILVVHQNHAKHGPTNYLPEEFIPNFFDLVIWGHEHECRIDPVKNGIKNFWVMQPGSTVQTSLSESEVGPKRCAIVAIGAHKAFSYETFALKAVRPFAFGTVVLDRDAPHIDAHAPDTREKVTEFLVEEVAKLVARAREQYQELHHCEPPLPLVRLRVDYTGNFEVENVARFSKRFEGEVANTSDVLHYFTRRDGRRMLPKYSTTAANARPQQQVGDLVALHLKQEQLQVLAEPEVVTALHDFVEKDERTAIKSSVETRVASKVRELTLHPAQSPAADLTTDVYNGQAQHEDSLFVEDQPEAISESEGSPPPTPPAVEPPAPKRSRAKTTRPAAKTTRARTASVAQPRVRAPRSTRQSRTVEPAGEPPAPEPLAPEPLDELGSDESGGMFD